MKLWLTALLFFVSFQAYATRQLSFATYNVRNFDYDRRADIPTNKSHLAKIIKSMKADLIAVEEVVNKDEFEYLINNKFPEYEFVLSRCGGAGQQKLGFIYKSSVLRLDKFSEDYRISNNGDCQKGLRPAVIGNFTVRQSGMSFTAIGLHLKAGGAARNIEFRFEQLNILSKIIKELKNKGKRDLVIMGDMNTTEYSLKGVNHERFVKYIKQNRLIDLSASLKCTSYWWGGVDDGFEYASHLDHVILTRTFHNKFTSRKIKNLAHCAKVSCRNSISDDLGISFTEVSDHCPVIATVK